jgi:hypothetical protein
MCLSVLRYFDNDTKYNTGTNTLRLDLSNYELEVACWPFVATFAGSNPAEAVGFFRAKKKSSKTLPQSGSKKPVPGRRFAAGKRTIKVALTRYFQAKFTGHFSPNSSTFHC